MHFSSQGSNPYVHWKNQFSGKSSSEYKRMQKKGTTISIISQVATIAGPGGIGKSETARMYIKKFNKDYDNIVWIDAEHSSEITEQFKFIAAKKLKISLNDEENQPREFSHILQDVYERLCRKPKLLLIVFDNAEALDNTGPITDGIRQFLPPQTSTIEPPIVLVTSRQQNWEDVNVKTLGLWETEECIEFILERLNLQDTPENRMGAIKIAELFDRLPIAIQVAVSIIKEQAEEMGKRDYDINTLVTDYNSCDNATEGKKPAILARAPMQQLLHVSVTKIKQHKHGKVALKILAFMAYLSPTKIPTVMIQWLFQHTNEQHEVDVAIALLTRYSIIQMFDNYVTIHRVFQDLIIHILCHSHTQEPKPNDSRAALCTDNLTTKQDGLKHYSNELRVLEEVLHTVLEWLREEGIAENELKNIIDLDVSVTKLVLLFTIPYPDIFKAIVNIMMLVNQVKRGSYQLGDLKLGIREAIIDALCPETLNLLQAFFATFTDPRKHKSYVKDCLCLLSAFGNFNIAQHLYTVTLEQHNAQSLQNQRKTEEALQHFKFVLRTLEKLFGAHHPWTLMTKRNIAQCLSDQGKTKEALKQFSDVLEEQEKVLGPLHSETLRTKRSVSWHLQSQGKIAKALKHLTFVLFAQEKELGALHADTLHTKHSIVLCLKGQVRPNEALTDLQYIHDAQVKVLGDVHPNTLDTKNSLAVCLDNQRKSKEALKSFNDVLASMVNVLGAFHPNTLNTKHNMAVCLERLGNREEALKHYNDVLQARKEVFGAFHPATLDSVHTIAVCLLKHGKTGEAFKHFYYLLEAQEKQLGALHPFTLATIIDIEMRVLRHCKYNLLAIVLPICFFYFL